jgi:hypothetical protein
MTQPAISPRQLHRMRLQTLARLPGTCIITQPATVADGQGGYATTYTPVTGGTVACRLERLNRRAEQTEISARQEMLVEEYALVVPHDAPLSAHCRVEAAGGTFAIRTLDAYHDWRVARHAVVVRVED